MLTIFKPWVYVLLFFILPIILGFCFVLKEQWALNTKTEFLIEFRGKFISWCNSKFQDYNLYSDLITKTPKAQSFMGQWGIMAQSPPIGNFVARNWAILLNAIPIIREHHNFESVAFKFINLTDEALLRAIGDYQDSYKNQKSFLLNPIKLFLLGTSLILSFPFYLLAEFGLMSLKAYKSLFTSVIIKAISFFVLFLGVVSSAIGTVTGWTQFIEIIKKYLNF